MEPLSPPIRLAVARFLAAPLSSLAWVPPPDADRFCPLSLAPPVTFLACTNGDFDWRAFFVPFALRWWRWSEVSGQR